MPPPPRAFCGPGNTRCQDLPDDPARGEDTGLCLTLFLWNLALPTPARAAQQDVHLPATLRLSSPAVVRQLWALWAFCIRDPLREVPLSSAVFECTLSSGLLADGGWRHWPHGVWMGCQEVPEQKTGEHTCPHALMHALHSATPPKPGTSRSAWRRAANSSCLPAVWMAILFSVTVLHSSLVFTKSIRGTSF